MTSNFICYTISENNFQAGSIPAASSLRTIPSVLESKASQRRHHPQPIQLFASEWCWLLAAMPNSVENFPVFTQKRASNLASNHCFVTVFKLPKPDELELKRKIWLPNLLSRNIIFLNKKYGSLVKKCKDLAGKLKMPQLTEKQTLTV